ncbi:MAG: hypothetical protein U0Y10_17630 [Spirosomataceae bacterium]
MDNSKANYQEIANVAIKLLNELNQGEIKATAEIKEQANLIGKITNIFKGKLEYEINKHKVDKIEYFEEK